MGCNCVLFVGSLIVIFFILKYIYRLIFGDGAPNGDLGYKPQWFGKEPNPSEREKDIEEITITPFKIEISDEVLTDLKKRLDNTRFAEPIIGSKFLYGFNPDYLKEIVHYWKTKYDWRAQEVELNKYPHFKTPIEGLQIHFMHIKPTLPQDRQLKVIPLMIIHGWPGSFAEFYKIIPFLTTPQPDRDFVFEVICPSIPGYGFSETPYRKGCNARAVARIFITLMERLGYTRFYVQGGDWGSFIAAIMARYYSPRVTGLHLNMFTSSLKLWELIKLFTVAWLPFLIPPNEYPLIYPLRKKLRMAYEESGYFHLQSTKPDTLGSGLADSPAGLAAYLLEKFSVATNPEYPKLADGGLTQKFTLDELLTNIMLYWVNNTFTSAARFYKENLKAVYYQKHEKMPLTVPTAIAAFPHEVLMFPKMLVTGKIKNLVSYSVMPRGGHFAALEEPELLANDIWKFADVVENKND